MEVDKVLVRLDNLIEMGEKVLATRYRIPAVVGEYVKSGLFRQWRTSSLAFLTAVLGHDGVHYCEFESQCESAFSSDVERGTGILRAAKEDIEGGYLQKVETLVSAEVFNDFLEMAGHLLDNGYKDPSASLIGAVLENGLRRICGNNDLPVKSDDNISSLNRKLADKPVYNRLKQRKIEVWNKLRDYADHGHFDQYKLNDVSDMLKGVSSFLSDPLK